MYCKTAILPLFVLSSILIGQFPVDLGPDDSTDPYMFTTGMDTECLLIVIASANTNWSQEDAESATLVVAIDGNWNNYNQDIVLYAGEDEHLYYTSLGPISADEHNIQFKFDNEKSSIGAQLITVDSIELIDIATIDMDEDVLKHSPILYGRDLLS